MTSIHKKPTAGFWIAVSLVVLLAYPLSFGPACWIASRMPSSFGTRAPIIGRIYWPLLEAAWNAEGTAWDAASDYAQLFAEKGWVIGHVSGDDSFAFVCLRR